MTPHQAELHSTFNLIASLHATATSSCKVELIGFEIGLALKILLNLTF